MTGRGGGMADAAGELEAAIERLERALSRLEGRVRAARAAPPAPDLFNTAGGGRRDSELEAAAREASEALARAASEVRALIGAEG